MKRQAKSPQQKKIESYLRDGRNTYGENDKSSRRAIRFRKTWVNGTYRSAVNQRLRSLDPDDVTDAVGAVRRKDWKKAADRPLGQVVDRKLARRQSTAESGVAPSSALRRAAAKRRPR